MMSKEIIYDLGLLAERLPSHHSDFKGRIERWRDAHSSSADLKIASDFLELALRLNLAGDTELELAKMALMHAAVVAYGRAFETSPHNRREFSVTGAMDFAQVALHKNLIDLRHGSVGHHGPAGTIEPWSNDSVLLVQTGIRWQPMIASKKRVFEPTFAQTFHRHLSEIDQFVVAKVEKLRNRFQAMLDQKVQIAEVAELLKACELNSDQAAKFAGPLLSGRREGRKIVIVNDALAAQQPEKR